MIRYSLSFFLILLIIGCATVSSPTGGIKDDISPQLIYSNPQDQSINFTEKEIQLIFSEWMKVEQLQKELIISPRTKIQYEHNLRKEEFTLTFKDKLADSTTYTLNFRNALKDITEGNQWENPKISFSTGPYLDTMQLNGEVEDLFTTAKLENYTVGLYEPNIDTANLRQGEPLYFTTTNEQGKFNFTNVKKGMYLLYGFNDKNNNLINESSTESYTFYPTSIELTDTIDHILLKSYKNNEDTFQLKKANITGKDFKITYNKGLSNYKIQALNNDTLNFIYTMLTNDSREVIVFRENFPNLAYVSDSISLVIEAQDSLGAILNDTLSIKYRESKVVNPKINFKRKPNSNLTYGINEFTTQLNKPIRYINTDSIFIKIKDSIIYPLNKTQIKMNTHRTSFTFDIDLQNKYVDSVTRIIQSKYIKYDSMQLLRDSISKEDVITKDETLNTNSNKSKGVSRENKLNSNNAANFNQVNGDYNPYLYMAKGSIIGIENDSTEELNIRLKFLEPEKHGIIKGQVINANSPFVIQLLDESYQIIDTLINRTEYTFEYVKPGKYKIRVIIDENGNHQWDPGNPLTFKEPEKIIFLKETITLKANWELIDKNIDVNSGMDKLKSNVDNNKSTGG